jgi:hypothetical protein
VFFLSKNNHPPLPHAQHKCILQAYISCLLQNKIFPIWWRVKSQKLKVNSKNAMIKITTSYLYKRSFLKIAPFLNSILMMEFFKLSRYRYTLYILRLQSLFLWQCPAQSNNKTFNTFGNFNKCLCLIILLPDFDILISFTKYKSQSRLR